ncbi:hypothetical protein UPYG_G00227430 [Umbra pygmaea]|uniref:Uncharacterized protein n=1 Tax=Umbra pygmaea TaxID=75934 RepID=A0ABD0X0J4_UMBPY
MFRSSVFVHDLKLYIIWCAERSGTTWSPASPGGCYPLAVDEVQCYRVPSMGILPDHRFPTETDPDVIHHLTTLKLNRNRSSRFF